jgi:type III pantothenate kinase
MLLALDIGNSSVKFGLFDGADLIARAALPTEKIRSTGKVEGLADDISGRPIEGVIISSVVPELDPVFSIFFQTHFDLDPVFVDHTSNLGLAIKYDPPTAVGVDRLVAASAAAAKYAAPCIVCDFGTATTIDAINATYEYLGGTITPGIFTLARSLFQNTSKLPEIEIRKPASVIGGSTAGSIESGVFYGYLGLVEGILSRMKVELERDVKVIATGGGYVNLIAANTRIIDVVDENLVLEGLCHIYSKIRAVPAL